MSPAKKRTTNKARKKTKKKTKKKVSLKKALESELLAAASATEGHFVYESGHHGDLWLDLDALFEDARRARKWAKNLATSMRTARADVICGPETGGAFLAQLMAEETAATFAFTERRVTPTGAVGYAVPLELREELADSRVLMVDDAINAGSALRSSIADVQRCGGKVVGVAALMTLGDAAAELAKKHGVRLRTLASPRRRMWTAAECPLCESGVTLMRRLTDV